MGFAVDDDYRESVLEFVDRSQCANHGKVEIVVEGVYVELVIALTHGGEYIAHLGAIIAVTFVGVKV